MMDKDSIAAQANGDKRPVKGRFAPSPTGRMHLGNVWSALLSWLSAKSQGGTWLLRIEDLDPGRSRLEFARQIEDDLLWLGLEWDEGGLSHPANGRQTGTADGTQPLQGQRLTQATQGLPGPYCQSQRGAIYEEQLRRLEELGLTYPCWCTRADILATQAPHENDGRIVYAGTCRPAHLANISPETAGPSPTKSIESLPDISKSAANPSLHIQASNSLSNNQDRNQRNPATRLYVPNREITFTDRHYGPQSVNLATHCGDFVLRRGDGAWAYQLAVVADDALMGVTEVVRGRDLLLSAAQQIYLYDLLGFKAPEFAHLPLLCSAPGERLCKRDKSLDMGEIRKTHTAEEVIGFLAYSADLIPNNEPCKASDLIQYFNWENLPTEDLVVRFE